MADERREGERVPLPLEARLESASGKHPVRISDISLNGCYIESLGQVEVGERVRFEVQVPTGQWMQLGGKVVYTHLNIGFGVRFADLSDSKRRVLEQLIDYARAQHKP
ncbi:MAG TPA: PilZ domain-containing protein [Pyrinomonadaceae bacterium]|nr:PilZ domain-containing protein [Pyrinomonadaceae bacterium]